MYFNALVSMVEGEDTNLLLFLLSTCPLFLPFWFRQSLGFGFSPFAAHQPHPCLIWYHRRSNDPAHSRYLSIQEGGKEQHPSGPILGAGIVLDFASLCDKSLVMWCYEIVCCVLKMCSARRGTQTLSLAISRGSDSFPGCQSSTGFSCGYSWTIALAVILGLHFAYLKKYFSLLPYLLRYIWVNILLGPPAVILWSTPPPGVCTQDTLATSRDNMVSEQLWSTLPSGKPRVVCDFSPPQQGGTSHRSRRT